MKLKDGYILRKIANTDMIVPIGENIANFNGVISLNETAAFLWKGIKNGLELPNLVEALVNEYQVDKELAEADTMDFVAKLKEANLLIENA